MSEKIFIFKIMMKAFRLASDRNISIFWLCKLIEKTIFKSLKVLGDLSSLRIWAQRFNIQLNL